MNNQLQIKNKKQVNLTIQHSENESTPLKVAGLGDNPIVFTGSEGIIGDLYRRQKIMQYMAWVMEC